MRKRRALLRLALLALGLGASACQTSDETPIRVTIAPGPFAVAAESLAAHGIVKFPRLLRFYAARTGRDKTIRHGTYVINRGASWNYVLHALASGEGIVNRLVIPEGWALWDIVPEMSKVLDVPEDSAWVAVRDPQLLEQLGVPAGIRDAEGYLFPDTYDFPDGVTARQAVGLMVKRFEDVWLDEWDARAKAIGFTRHQVVTLASIVEKEVRKIAEAPTVSGVYHNRLRIGMALQADPTIQFALKRRRPGRVLYRDLNVKSPYNTYRRPGLPPGPIASPGAAALKAALNPADVPYRFFVAHPDGHHEFSRTFAEHQKAIKMVREAARQDSIARRVREAEQAQRALDSAMQGVHVPSDSSFLP